MRERALAPLLVAALVVPAGCLVFEALMRPRLVSNDPFNYVDVARNIALGRGITQSALGHNAARFPVDGGRPAPLTSQPPLYRSTRGSIPWPRSTIPSCSASDRRAAGGSP